MKKNKLFELNDEELKIEKNNFKKRKIINALLIGFLTGIFFIGSAALVKSENALGIIPLLLPLFLIYRLVSNSKKINS